MPLISESSRLGLPFIELQSVDSTNKYAMQLAHDGTAQHGMAVFAHEQTSGKGQRGKHWQSEKRKNIILSVIINPTPLIIKDVFKLNICVAYAAVSFFRKFAGEETYIKWPNDIYWRHRKAGGILVENIVRNQKSGGDGWPWSVIGIGININQTDFSRELINPVSLKQITGKEFDPVQLAKQLCETLDTWYTKLRNGQFENILALYNECLYRRNKKATLKMNSRVFEATILGVNEYGQLMIKHAIEENIDHGKVEWIK